jgi:hypothetical protein
MMSEAMKSRFVRTLHSEEIDSGGKIRCDAKTDLERWSRLWNASGRKLYMATGFTLIGL